jgi:hypothetical protein
MITRATLSTIEQGLPKYRSMLAGNTAFSPGVYESIATVSLTSGSSSSIVFSNIPTTYTHLQLRASYTFGGNGGTPRARVGNGSPDTGNNYAAHWITGDGSTVSASGISTSDLFYLGLGYERADRQAMIMDILDYANTNKFKTIRYLLGYDGNGNGQMSTNSAVWQSTSVLNYIQFTVQLNNYSQYSHFALYGIKSA